MVQIDYNNKQQVREYLNYKLLQHKFNKGKKFFRTLVRLYDFYPKTIKSIIDNLHKFTNYKDYLNLLCNSRNEDLNNYVYELLIKQLKKDMYNYDIGFNISTLAKWLPRKGKKFDKLLNFVNKFINIYFRNNQNLVFDDKKYEKYVKTRKYTIILTTLTRKINPIEIHLSSKNYAGINFEKLTNKNLQTYNNTLQKHKEYEFENYLKFKYENMSYENYVRRVFWIHGLNNYKKTTYIKEIKIINEIWNNKFDNFAKKKILQNKCLVLDVNSEVLNRYKIELFEIIFQALHEHNKIIINRRICIVINKETDIFKNISNILKNISICPILDLENLKNITDKQLLLLSYKNYDSVKNINNNFTYLQLNKNKLNKISENNYEGNPFFVNFKNDKQILMDQIFRNNKKEIYDEKSYSKIILSVLFVFMIFLLMIFTKIFIY